MGFKPHWFPLCVGVLWHTVTGDKVVARDSRTVGHAQAALGNKTVTCHGMVQVARRESGLFARL